MWEIGDFFYVATSHGISFIVLGSQMVTGMLCYITTVEGWQLIMCNNV